MPSHIGLRTGVLLPSWLCFAALAAGIETGLPSVPLLRREDTALASRTGAVQSTSNPHALFTVSARRDFDKHLLARWHDHSKRHLLNSMSKTWGEALEELGEAEISKEKAQQAMQRVPVGSLSNSVLSSPRTICETGFSAGRSLVAFLERTRAVTYEFGANDSPRAKKAARFIRRRFPGRSHHIWGNSIETLPAFREQHPDVRCELLVVDGGSRSEDVPLAELRHFAAMAAGVHLVALDSTRCEAETDAPGCGTGASKAWLHLVQSGCIRELGVNSKLQDRGARMGQFTPCALWNSEGSAMPGHIIPASAMEVSTRSHRGDVNLDDHRESLDQHALALLQGNRLVQDAITDLDKLIKDRKWSVTEGHIEPAGLLKLQTDRYDQWAHDENIRTVCESGFGAGHSALRFLAQTKNTSVVSFDLGYHPYSKAAVALLLGKFGNRFQITWGDTRQTINSFHAKHRNIACDLIIVDGGNDQTTAYEDLGNFAQMAAKGHILALDDTPCNAGYCVGPRQAWKSLIEEGCIVEKETVQMGPERGFSIGEYRECPYWPNLYLGSRISVS
mmetsp:Transcript_90094/g.165331  ORF Transcript_90094/g.165331 Transcript_90094/m.165331 type:complete len:561 (+) Transcript_90094:46-1728(+)